MAANYHFSDRRARGNVILIALAVLVLLSLAGAAAWYFLVRAPAVNPPAEQTQAPAGDTAAGAGTAATPTAEAPAPGAVDRLNSLTVDQLLKEARTAMNEQRLVAPPSNNALEYYLKILEKEPGNSNAREALREIFTFAASAAEQEINGRNIDGAQRVIELLTKVDPNNYTLTILRSKLDAQKRIVDREAAQAAAQVEAQARRAAAAEQGATTPAAAGSGTGAATPGATASTSSAPGATPSTGPATPGSTPAASPSTAAATPTPPPVAAAPSGETRDAVLVGQAQPAYPTAAVRRRQEGWVMVEFTVTSAGGVANARVVDSDPPRTFDRAALDAVQKWTFRPAVRNGESVDATVRRRIEFKM